jgi:hypothetical protein
MSLDFICLQKVPGNTRIGFNATTAVARRLSHPRKRVTDNVSKPADSSLSTLRNRPTASETAVGSDGQQRHDLCYDHHLVIIVQNGSSCGVATRKDDCPSKKED